MTHRRRLAKPLTLTGLVGSNPTPGAPVNLPPMLITRPTGVKTGRSSSSVRTSDQLRQALTQRRSSVRITPGPPPLIGANPGLSFPCRCLEDWMESTNHGTKSGRVREVDERSHLTLRWVGASNQSRSTSHFSANRLERLSTLIRDLQYGRVPLHRLDGLRQARCRAHRKDKVSRTNLRPDHRNRERRHPCRHGHRGPARGADRLHHREVLHGRRGEGKAQDSLDAYGGRQGKEGARGRRLDRRV